MDFGNSVMAFAGAVWDRPKSNEFLWPAPAETVSFVATLILVCPVISLPRHCEGIHARGNPFSFYNCL